MDLKELAQIPVWEWPSDTDVTLLDVLRNRSAPESDREIAVHMAGDLTVMSDEIATALLAILQNPAEPAELRGHAAIALGAVLEDGDVQGFEDSDDMPISEQMFNRIIDDLHRAFADRSVPDLVRRRVLEASVRAPRDWHAAAIRDAWKSTNGDWKLTALFGMGYVQGFETQILEGLTSDDEELHYEAVVAAGEREVDAAWPEVEAIIASETEDKDLLIAAIEAAACIRPADALTLLPPLVDHEDEEIADAARESLVMARGLLGEADDLDEDEES